MAEDFFKQHPWVPGEIDWCFHVLFDTQPQVAELTAEYREALAHPGLYSPITDEWLHMTVLRVAPVNKVSQTEMEEVIKLLKLQLVGMKLPEFMLGPSWMWGGNNPVLHVAPKAPLTEIFDKLSGILENVIGSRAPRSDRFIPHVTLAYNRDHNDEKGIHSRLSKVSYQPVNFRVNELALVKQRQLPPQYEWEVIETIPIGQA